MRSLNRSVTLGFFLSLPLAILLLVVIISVTSFQPSPPRNNMMLSCKTRLLLAAGCSNSRGFTLRSLSAAASAAASDAPMAKIASADAASVTSTASSSSTSMSTTDSDATSNIQKLCKTRNLPFAQVKNARDLASATTNSSSNVKVQPNRLFRMGRVSDASEHDVNILLNDLQFQTLIDLRSLTEWKEDRAGIMRSDLFGNFTSLVYKESSRSNTIHKQMNGCVRELMADEFPVKEPFWSRNDKEQDGNSKSRDKTIIDIMENEPKMATLAAAATEHTLETTVTDAAAAGDAPSTTAASSTDSTDVLCDLDCDDPEFSVPASQLPFKNRRERHFVSLMNELKYVRGTLGRVRKRDTLAAMIKSPGALLSSRIRTSVKEPFLAKINAGGLNMLNELLLRYGAPGIKYVLELCADRQRHPVGFYCTAGKDRTGMIAAIILSLCGVNREDIVTDYSLSANVYAEMNDHKAMVGALSQRSLDAKTFLGAPASVMRETLEAIDKEYGSVEGYCDWIGFGPEQREKLRKACLDE
ncbi:hypothetical protein MPSEU_000556200 [Mayamaea pseudoterrestris]|nr:hypothetical protein MPSEU_000556200 [Mayamaea pseudoterrestris]